MVSSGLSDLYKYHDNYNCVYIIFVSVLTGIVCSVCECLAEEQCLKHILPLIKVSLTHLNLSIL